MPIETPTPGSIIEGRIEKIAFGGEGILRYRGLVVFIPFTAPGDLVTCRLKTKKKSFATAELVSIDQPSTNRIEPLCPYFGTCGGCQLQHINLQQQNIYKKQAVIDALKRIGHLEVLNPTFIPASSVWAYRRHITLHLEPYKDGFQAGYIGTDHCSLVVIKTCPIFNVFEDPIIKDIQLILSNLSNPDKRSGRLTVLKNHKGHYILSFIFPTPLTIEPRLFTQILQQYPHFTGILFQDGEKNWVFGDPYSEQKLKGLHFRFTPQTFIQNHFEQSVNIYNQICNLAQQPKKILDLYCGFGMTSLLLSQEGHTVLGIEANPEAIRFAEQNARANQLTKTRFIARHVESILEKILYDFKPDLILLNPPRSGLSKYVVNTLLESKIPEIIYVSCMPPTLARDLGHLCENKYKLTDCWIYDMFPQTAHVETLVHLRTLIT